MSELSLIQKGEIASLFVKKATIVNSRGDFSVEGVILSGLDGERTLKIAQEGIENDASELGATGTVKLYKRLAGTPGRLGKALKTSQRFARELDADRIAGR